MTLRRPDYRNPQAVILTMTHEEYDEYQRHGKKIQQVWRSLEVEAELQSKTDNKVSMQIKPAPRDWFGSIFIGLIAGKPRFITMRAEEFAQDLEDYGFTVEIS